MLRKRIGYRGIILSDDLEMGGILKFLPVDEAAIAAVRAGMDLLEICHSPELILRSYEALIARRRDDRRRFASCCLRGRAKWHGSERSFTRKALRGALTAKQLEALRVRIERFSDAIAAQREDDAIDAASDCSGGDLMNARRNDRSRRHERHFGRRDRCGRGADRARRKTCGRSSRCWRMKAFPTLPRCGARCWRR